MKIIKNEVKEFLIKRKENIEKEIQKILNDNCHQLIDEDKHKDYRINENKFLVEVFSETSFFKRQLLIKENKNKKIEMHNRFYNDYMLCEPFSIIFGDNEKVIKYKEEFDYELNTEKVIALFEKEDFNLMSMYCKYDIRCGNEKSATILIIEK